MRSVDVKCCANCIHWDDFHKSLTVPEKFPCGIPIMPVETAAEDYCSYYFPRNRKKLVNNEIR